VPAAVGSHPAFESWGGPHIVQLPDWLTGADAEHERDSQRDGAFSYSKENHAFVLGLGAGLLTGLTGRRDLAVVVAAVALGVRAAPTGRLKQLRKEPWYALGGLILGFLAGLLTSPLT